jgi:hypothetical protein
MPSPTPPARQFASSATLASRKIASEAANETRIELWEQIESTPAQSITGIALKLAAVMLWDDGLKDVWTGRDQGEQGDHVPGRSC